MSSSPRAHTRLLLGGAAALAGLVLIAYLALPLVLAGWLERILTDKGFTNVRIELGYPGLHEMRVHRLALTGAGAGQDFTFSASELDLDYDLATLPRGRLRHLHIPDATLRIHPGAPDIVTPPEPVSILLLLPARWLAAVPLQKLDVDKLLVEWRKRDGSILSGSVHGQAQRDDTQLNTRWSLASETRPLAEITLHAATTGELTVALARPDAPDKPIVRAHATMVANESDTVAVRGSLEAQFGPLATLLSPWLALPKTVIPVDGRLLARWYGTGPAELPAAPGAADFSGNLSLELSALRLGTILQDGNLRLDATLATRDGSIHWRISDSLRCSAYLNPAVLALTGHADRSRYVRTAKPLVVRAPHGLSGQLMRTPALQLAIAPGSVWVVEQLESPDVRISKLTATLPVATLLTHEPRRSQWTTGGLAVALDVPVIQPEFAAIGAVERLTLAAKLGAGPLAPLPPVTVNDAAMTVFGGRVRAQDVHYDRARDTNAFALDLEHIDLARIVAVEQQQQIEASGTLDGRLPINITPRGVRIEDGTLRASAAGGVIRYHPNQTVRSMAQANPNLKLVLDALSNYHYSKLDVGVNYAENGDLVLQVAMAGRNPDWNANQPVSLNVNLSENIPILLRSLRLASDISEKVEQRVRERSKPKP
jgi:hypothetical protein